MKEALAAAQAGDFDRTKQLMQQAERKLRTIADDLSGSLKP
jgi:cellobiose-specific phosphotransferase system component IIA